MSILEAILLGIVQGLCEFLPVSSSGHLVLLQSIFGIQEGTLFFDAMLHLGTLVAVCVYFRKTLWQMLRHPFSKYPMYIVIATIPTVVVALLFGDFIETAFSGSFLGVSFLITALILFITVQIPKQKRDLKDMQWYDAGFIGLMQAFAIVPGISRSGSTIMGGTVRGFNHDLVAEFSFLMSVPAILGSCVLEVVKITKTGLGDISISGTLVGVLCAMIAGFFAINMMMRLIRKGKLAGFGIYCAVLGVLVLVDQHITHIFL